MKQNENLIESIPEVVPPKPVMPPPESYQSTGSSWDVLEYVGIGLDALVDVLNIFD